ncbi:mitochondrial CCA tRNA nucleotidyltransferase [Achaetomium macrosporum]|uniref:Mitochondrial CCA tRNA nucleotidyltransferase n=1 Tax=Achaetomium macrosporum TaxID=79813 RepID=A0AAN7CBX6_9PEZI|nr:mitochondrial CCA tRNA nucleotidyltransferase [Achaetomium macrosporum]
MASRPLPTITLNSREEQLKTLLLEAAKSIDDHDFGTDQPPRRDRLVLRWAGGWVRDKLLGITSHDIDTAINAMTGEAFVDRLRDYCDVPAHRERHALQPEDVGRLHTVPRNPDRSKHLATSTIRLCGLDVDFVNLRKETYTADSRNPVVEFGTAEEDALRRDASVNALFYNLHTGEVEDFVGGLEDLERGLIRTPMEPLQTFLDDPLRVLRLVRFASRLGFRIDEEAERVMADERVLGNLRVKISRERIGVELEKMLKGKRPVESLRLIDRLGLYHAVFTNPEREDMPQPDTATWRVAYETLEQLEATKTPGSIYDLLATSEEARYYAWSLATLTPWEHLPDDPPLKPGKPALPLPMQAAREGFKAPNKLCDIITAAHRHRPAILELKDVVRDRRESMNERDRFGMTIRDWDSRGGNWRLQVLYAILVDVEIRVGAGSKGGGGTLESVLAEWQQFLDHLVELDVMNAPSIKRLVDGKILSKELGVKPGTWMGAALNVALAWQFRNPGAQDPAGAVEEELGMVRTELLAVLICLQCEDRIRVTSTDEDRDAVQELARNIAKAIAPAVSQDEGADRDDAVPAGRLIAVPVFNETLSKASKQLILHCMSVYSLGISALEALVKQAHAVQLDDEVLVTLLFFTDDTRRWVNPDARKGANRILEQHFNAASPTKEQVITEVVLQRYLRPVFSRSKPASITASGRKAEYTDGTANRGESIPDDTALTKPWKYTDFRAIPAVAWAVREADSQLIATNWPLFIPVLLTLVDDSTTPIRRQGLLILTDFLSKFPDKTLHDTGLAKVFEDAVFPTLAFLPSLTPEAESVQLLGPAYRALLSLANKQPPVGKDGVRGEPKNSLLDRLLREGVFTGYFHAKDHVHIVKVLCQQTVAILNEMGIHAVKHLKDLIPMLSSIMTDPFAPVAPATLFAAIKALQAVLADCWPRIPASPWQDEIINALVLCWLHLVEHDRSSAKESEKATYSLIEQELITSAKALSIVLKTAEEGAIDLSAHVAPLVEKEPRLGGLFSPSD